MSRHLRTVSIVILVSILSLGLAGSVSARPPAQEPSPQEVFAQMQQEASGELEIYWNPDTGVPDFLSGAIPTDVSAAEEGDPEMIARSFFAAYEQLYRMDDPGTELALKKVERDHLGLTHVWFTQEHQGVKVFGMELAVHLDGGKRIVAVGGQYLPDIDLSARPDVPVETAIATARAHLDDAEAELWEADTELVFYRGFDDGEYHLAWKMRLLSDEPPGEWIYFVDAHRGAVIDRYNDLKSGLFRMIYDANHGTTLPGVLKRSEAAAATGDLSVDDLYTHLGTAYNYYNSRWGRDNYDKDADTRTIATVHYSTNYNNAYWSTSKEQFVFGDGDGVKFSALARDQDVVVHEYTHAVTDNEVNLIYYDQSGALSEAFSDIFAAMADPGDWTIGEDSYLPAPGYLRSLADPTLGGQYDVNDPMNSKGLPGHMNQYAALPTSLDNGGVHINMGIPGKAAYLIAQTIGRGKAELIFYRALTEYLTPSSGFSFFKAASLQSCTDLISPTLGITTTVTTTDCDYVEAGFAAVGIGSSPSPTYSVQVPIVVKGYAPPAGSGIYGQVTIPCPTGVNCSVALALRYYDGSTWSIKATTNTDTQGHYLFTGIPSLGAGGIYYVRYGPNTTIPGQLYYWWADYINTYTAGTTLWGTDFDLADVTLVKPSSGSTVALPVTFSWTRRNVSSDLYYQVRLLAADQTTVLWESPLLRTQSSYTLNSRPSGIDAGKQYYWDVKVYGTHGYGVCYAVRKITFATVSGAESGVLEAGTLPDEPHPPLDQN